MFLFQIQFGQNWAFILFLVCDDLIGANLFLKQCIKVLPQFTNVSVKQYLPTYLPTNLPTYHLHFIVTYEVPKPTFTTNGVQNDPSILSNLFVTFAS